MAVRVSVPLQLSNSYRILHGKFFPAKSSMSDCPNRWRKLVFVWQKALHGILKQSKDSLTEDVVLKTLEYAKVKFNLEGPPNHLDDVGLF